MPQNQDLTSLIDLVKLHKTPKGNRRLLGLVLVAILAAGGLSLWYYLHIQSNEKQYAEYSLEMLDYNYKRLQRQLDNDYLRVLSRDTVKILDDSISPSKPDITLVHLQAGLTLPSSFTDKKTNARKVRLRAPFQDYLIAIQSRNSNSHKVLHQSFPWSAKTLVDTMPENGFSKPIAMGQTVRFVTARKYNYVYSDPYLEQDFDILMVGITPLDEFKQRTRSLSPLLLIVLTSFLLIAIFGLQYFKLVFISEHEQIRRADAVFAGILTIVGTLVFLALVMGTCDYIKLYTDTVPDRLKGLADSLKSRFENENRQTVYDLYDLADRLNMCGNSCCTVRTLNEKANSTDFRENTIGKNFKIVGAVDGAGKVRGDMMWYIEGKVPSKEAADLSRRSYFKAIASGDLMRIDWGRKDTLMCLKNDNEFAMMDYVMRPVVSIESDHEEAVYIINACSNTDTSCKDRLDPKDTIRHLFLLAGVQLKSLHEPILHEGYQYAIIDSEGEVWFHSEAGRSTLENLLDLSRRTNDLRSAHMGRVSGKGLFDYRNETVLFHSFPIEDTDLTIVAMYPHQLLSSHILATLPLYYIPLLLMLGLLAIFVFATAISRKQSSKFQLARSFAFDFLRPSAKRRRVYLSLGIASLVLSAIVILLMNLRPLNIPSGVFLSAGCIPIFSFLLVFGMLRNERRSQKTLTTVVLIILLIFLNILLINASSDRSSEPSFFLPFIIEGLFLVAFFILKALSVKWKNKESITTSQNTSYQAYKFFLITWLVSSLLLPAYILYQKSAALNDIVWLRSDMLHVAESMVYKGDMLNKKTPWLEAFDEEERSKLIREHFNMGFYAIRFSVDEEINAPNIKSESEQSYWRNLYWRVQPHLFGTYTHFTGYLSAQDQEWVSCASKDNMYLKFSHFNNFNELDGHIMACKLERNYSISTESSRVVVLILGIILLLSLISFYVDRFFGLKFSDLSNSAADEGQNGQSDRLRNIIESDNVAGIIIVGTLSSRKYELAKAIITGTNEETVDNSPKSASTTRHLELSVLDYSGISSTDPAGDNLTKLFGTSDWKSEKYKYVLFRDLGHNIRSFESNRIKLRLISQLIKENKKIIITSEVYPSQLLDFYMDQVDDTGKLKSELLADHNAWRDILGGFVQVVRPIDTKHGMYAAIRDYRMITGSEVTVDPDSNIEEDQNLKLTSAGYNYFADIWNALPNRERFLLYDLATDDFVNIKNATSLYYLMKKGLVVWDRDRNLRIFSPEFRHYILTSDAKKEVIEYQRRNQVAGSWSSIRPVFYLVIVMVIIFIALAQPGFFSSLEEFYGTIAGLGALIPIFGTFFFKRSNS